MPAPPGLWKTWPPRRRLRLARDMRHPEHTESKTLELKYIKMHFRTIRGMASKVVAMASYLLAMASDLKMLYIECILNFAAS